MPGKDFNIISYDFDSLKREIFKRLHRQSEWKNITEEDPTVMLLIHILATFTTFNIATFNRAFIDYFPHISAAEEAVYRFADFITMRIDRDRSSRGVVRFYFDRPHPEQVVIPAGTEVAAGNIIFSTMATVLINPGELESSVEVIQGQWKSLHYTSNGEDFQKYFIYDRVENDNLIVLVSGVEWQWVDNFYFSENEDTHYRTKKVKGGLAVIFNDGVFGKKPGLGSQIEIRYFTTLGEAGNIYAAGMINKVLNPIHDTTDKTIKLKVTNDTPFLNGANSLSFRDIQQNISRFFTTNPYITRKQDYIDHLLSHPNVIDVNVYAGWEISSDYKEWTTIFIYVVPKMGKVLTTTAKKELFEYIKMRDIFFSRINFRDCIYIGNHLDIRIMFREKGLSEKKIEEIKVGIKEIIDNYYDFELAMKSSGTVFRSVYHSELVSRLLKIEELKKVNLRLQTVEEIASIEENILSYSKSLNYTRLKAGGCYLYLDGEEVGKYDEGWQLTTLPEWQGKINSSIDSLTYQLELNIEEPLIVDSKNADSIIGRKLYLRADSLNGDDLVAGADNLIFEYYGHSITIEEED